VARPSSFCRATVRALKVLAQVHALGVMNSKPVFTNDLKQMSALTRPLIAAFAGENSIIIVGGANQAEWSLSEAAKAEVTKAGQVVKARCAPSSERAFDKPV